MAIETVGNGGSGWLVNDTKDLKTSDGTSILGGKTLRVVEVGGNPTGDGRYMAFIEIEICSRYDSLLDSLAELGFRDLLHLNEDHRRDLLGAEALLLAEVVDLNEGRAVPVNNLEGLVGHVLLNVGVTKN